MLQALVLVHDQLLPLLTRVSQQPMDEKRMPAASPRLTILAPGGLQQLRNCLLSAAWAILSCAFLVPAEESGAGSSSSGSGPAQVGCGRTSIWLTSRSSTLDFVALPQVQYPALCTQLF